MELKTYFAQDASGNIMPGATVTVYEAGTATLATGLQEESGAPLANPFTADDSAKVAFYAPDGLYDITVVGNGRTVTIRAQFATLGAAVTAEKLKTARTIAITGDLSWSTSFDGSGNVTASGTLANSGVTTGTYRSVTVDAKGRVTSGTNPTTLSGYGITDAAPKNSPAFTGDPTAPTQATGDSSTKIASTAFVTNTALGIGQTWQDVKASRSIGTTYTNTTGKPIVVSVSFQSTASINSAIFFMGAQVFGQSAGGFVGAIFNLCAIVPPGGTYRMTVDFANVLYWVELR